MKYIPSVGTRTIYIGGSDGMLHSWIYRPKKGRLTRKRYRVTTVYIDHFPDLTYTYNPESTTSAETLASKHAFEVYTREKGISKISHYHSDNRCFIDNAFFNNCTKQGQSQSCCGVNAHHQTGKVEKRIRNLGDNARMLLIHSVYKWNGVINRSLWPLHLDILPMLGILYRIGKMAQVLLNVLWAQKSDQI